MYVNIWSFYFLGKIDILICKKIICGIKHDCKQVIFILRWLRHTGQTNIFFFSMLLGRKKFGIICINPPTWKFVPNHSINFIIGKILNVATYSWPISFRLNLQTKHSIYHFRLTLSHHLNYSGCKFINCMVWKLKLR